MSDRPFTIQEPEARDRFIAALHAAIKHKIETAKDAFSAEEIVNAFIWDQMSIWDDVRDDFARHALADYIDQILINNGPSAEDLEALISRFKDTAEE